MCVCVCVTLVLSCKSALKLKQNLKYRQQYRNALIIFYHFALSYFTS